jgi:hypothetical protein
MYLALQYHANRSFSSATVHKESPFFCGLQDVANRSKNVVGFFNPLANDAFNV